MITSESIDQIAVAMAKAQAAITPADKANTNPAFRSKYADLAAFWDAARNPLTANGLSVWQDVTSNETGACITTRIMHTSGQWVEFGPLCVPADKRNAQGVGSAITYGRRYAFAAACGLVSDDDDGNAAVESTSSRREESRRTNGQNGSVDVGGEIVETSITDVKRSSDGKRFSVQLGTGAWVTTFKEDLAQRAKAHKGTGEIVRVVLKRNGDHLNILALTLVESEGTAPDAALPMPPAVNDSEVPF